MITEVDVKNTQKRKQRALTKNQHRKETLRYFEFQSPATSPHLLCAVDFGHMKPRGGPGGLTGLDVDGFGTAPSVGVREPAWTQIKGASLEAGVQSVGRCRSKHQAEPSVLTVR